jgi:hypothetical protein
MGVGDHDAVDPLQRDAGAVKAVEQVLPRLRAGEAGIDDGEAALVFERVAVDVPQAGEPDGELHPQDAGSDLGDLRGGVLLLLLRRPRLHGAEGT